MYELLKHLGINLALPNTKSMPAQKQHLNKRCRALILNAIYWLLATEMNFEEVSFTIYGHGSHFGFVIF